MAHIQTKWAERKDRLYITLEVTSASDVQVNFEEKKISVAARGIPAQTSEPRELHCELPLLKAITPAESTYKVLGACIQICAIKKDTEYWNHLVDLPARQVKSWLSVDWNLWKDEDDEALGDNRDAGFGGYGDMSSMLGGGAGGMDFSSMMQNMPPMEGGDSDDEEEDGAQIEDDAEEEELPKPSEEAAESKDSA
ncbi:unnamed protein product [Phytomonas sp. EM1]|eukprot:CCW61365.1 unnamed protein product [Phytomonas sp. isolate EM1]